MENSHLQQFLKELVMTTPQLFAVDLTKIKESICQKFIYNEFNLQLQKIIFCNFRESDKFMIHIVSHKYFTLKVKDGGYTDIFIDIPHFIKELYTNENGLRLLYAEILLMANVKDCIEFYVPLKDTPNLFNYEWLLRLTYDDYFDFLTAINISERKEQYLKCIVDTLFAFIDAGKCDKVFSAEYYDMIENIKPEDDFMVQDSFCINNFSITSAIILLQETSDINIHSNVNYILYFSKEKSLKRGRVFRNSKIEPIKYKFPTYESCMNYLFMNKENIKKYSSYSVQCQMTTTTSYGGVVMEDVRNVLHYDDTRKLPEINKKLEEIRLYLDSVIA